MNYKVDYKGVRPYQNLFYKIIPTDGAFRIGDTVELHERQDVALIQNDNVVDLVLNASGSVTIDKKTFPHLKKGLLSKKVKGYLLLSFRGVKCAKVFTPDMRVSKQFFYTNEFGKNYGVELNFAFSDVTYNFFKLVKLFKNENKTGPLSFNLYNWMSTGGIAIFKEEWDKLARKNSRALQCYLDDDNSMIIPCAFTKTTMGLIDVVNATDERIGKTFRDILGINTTVVLKTPTTEDNQETFKYR